MTDAHTSSAQDTATEAAAHWCMRLHEDDCTDAERRAFEEWLAADPLHAAEYEAMLEIWDVADQLPRVAPASSPAPTTRMSSPKPAISRHRSWRRYGVAAAISLMALPVAGYVGWDMGWLPSSYQRFESTDLMRQVTLNDGSEVQLNLGTQLTYANYKDQRRVTLKKGEAFFEVTHSADHPFVVKAAQGEVRVTGTQFNVWMYQDQVRVTLLKGSVIVTTASDHEGYRLDPGMQASYKTGDYEPQIRQLYDNNSALAWRNGKLVLDNLTLRDALPLINRYLDSPLLLSDDTTGALRIGGIYNTSQVKNLVTTLPKVLPVTVSQNPSGETVLSAKADVRNRG